MILGTAGHIDHGKTALVRALTGVDTDRLPEEQRRGITIELGFAPLRLPGVGTIGVVDVPGHEAFVRTMLAGASGIDLALLVIAADEGVMPQTREHLTILGLLGIRAGVIALTKADLVDDEWLSLVRDDVTSLVRGSALEGAPQIAVSTITGLGLDALRGALADAAAGAPERDADDLFRLPVDRAFTVRGTGTVVTGTVWTGRLRKDDVVHILPSGRRARVRALQSHGVAIDVAEPGSRLAVSLGGVEIADVPRGSTLVTDPAWEPVDVVRADVQLLGNAPELSARARVRFHLGTRDVSARIVPSTGGGSPGTELAALKGLQASRLTSARIVLDEAIAARGGDRFVVRTGSPPTTIGGGTITDAAPGHARVRPWHVAAQPIAERIWEMVRDAASRGVPSEGLPIRAGLRPSEMAAVTRSLSDRVESIGGVLYDREAIAEVERRAMELVSAHHDRAPLEEGLSQQSLRGALKASPALSDAVIDRLVAARALVAERGVVRRNDWTVRPTATQETLLAALGRAVVEADREPPSVPELAASGMGPPDSVTTLLRLLERRGVIRQVESERFYSVGILSQLGEALRTGMAAGREYGPAELREFLGVSRKYLIPLLEYFDRIGVTERRANGRVIAASQR